ncbi:hypothetical protein FRC19_004115 [Serendipita sp. 401]|nr:hypothetical protein FRC19_004115 [Serendipita sp. 401]KAG9038620.1 hypothetical protein FS842_003250 [Serendipita sp. 407]
MEHVAAPLLAQAIRRSGSGNKSGGSTRLSGEMMDTGMTRTSSGVVRTRDEEEATDQLRPLSKKPKRKVDQTSKLLARWRQPIDVPDVVTLLKHLQTPLSEEEKVPVSQEQFDHLVTTYNPDAPKGELGAEKVAALFRVNEEEEADSIHILLAYVLGWTPQTSGTESAFHAIWDVNISRIMGTILLDGKFIRDSNQNTNTALKRPDYGFLVRKYCLFRGEEKSPDSSDNPEQELIEKLVDFPYQPLKFILGYYAFGTDVNYVAITHPPVTTEPLFAHNLERKAERLDNLVHLIRLCSALSWMSEQLAPRNNPEFTAIDRPGGVEVTIGVAVKKRFTQPDAVNHVLHLEAIYDLLKKKKVPNTDELVNINTTTDPHIMTKPVGVDCVPRTGAELFQAAICVLQALKVMHAEPEPVYHRDIRQPNILRRRDQEGWFLIDWSDASKTPTKASRTLLERSHSPRVFEDDHGGEVDVWGVGCYLHEYAYRCKATEPEKIREISRRWMANYTITAAAALDELETSEHFFTTNPQHGT